MLTSYLSHPYNVQSVLQVFIDNIVKLHGMPVVIVSDRDRIFTSKFYQDILTSFKVKLSFSTAHHPQSGGQTERINQCLEQYLRNMVFQHPKDWMNWLSMAEWWYNTSYHTSLKVSPFEALYAYHPPQIGELSLPRTILPEARATVEEREKMREQLKGNLLQAQDRMKYFADLKRTERHLQVGDNVYIKVQPYRQNAFGLRGSLKLRSKYYGPYKVLAKVGQVAYRLQLPETALIHPVFHISHLKKPSLYLMFPLSLKMAGSKQLHLLVWTSESYKETKPLLHSGWYTGRTLLQSRLPGKTRHSSKLHFQSLLHFLLVLLIYLELLVDK